MVDESGRGLPGLEPFERLGVQLGMGYWLYLAAKLTVAGLISWMGLTGLDALWPIESLARDLGYTSAVGAWFLICSGLFYLCIWDQRYRCRVCLRRLRMPVESGSWSSMLQRGRPRTEYICTYGHGRLNVEELQIFGAEPPEWTPQADMWEELASAGRNDKQAPGR